MVGINPNLEWIQERMGNKGNKWMWQITTLEFQYKELQKNLAISESGSGIKKKNIHMSIY